MDSFLFFLFLRGGEVGTLLFLKYYEVLPLLENEQAKY